MIKAWTADKEFLAANFGLAVTLGRLDGASKIDKFGENPEIDVGLVPADIWEGGAVGEASALYPFSSVSDIDSISSNDAGDVGQIISIQGILQPDAQSSEHTGYAKLNGQNRVPIYETEAEAEAGSGNEISFWRVYRMGNEADAGSELVGMVYCYVNGAITNGKPDDVNDIRAIINDGNNQTLMSIYTIPPGKVGYLFRGEIGASRDANNGTGQASYYSRRFGKVFKVKKRVAVSSNGSSIYQDEREFADVIPALTDIRLTIESVSDNNFGAFGTFDILLVDEDQLPENYLTAIGQPGY